MKQSFNFMCRSGAFIFIYFIFYVFRNGKVCALCYCGDKSLLGQGDLTRYNPTPNFNPFRKSTPRSSRSSRDLSGLSPSTESDGFMKSPSGRSRETRFR